MIENGLKAAGKDLMKLSHLALLLLAASSYGISQKIAVETVTNPSGEGAIQANWTTMPDGSPLLSWVTNEDDGSMNLVYSVRKAGQWSKPRLIAAKRDFFRHPAELPGVVALADGTLLAHWVEQPEDADDAEFLWVTASHEDRKSTRLNSSHT